MENTREFMINGFRKRESKFDGLQYKNGAVIVELIGNLFYSMR